VVFIGEIRIDEDRRIKRGGAKKLEGKIRQWEIGGKKLGSDPIQINNDNIFHTSTTDINKG
jgi:hypothetical protein